MFARARRRSTTRQTNSGPEISIPSRLDWFAFVFLSVWLAIWGVTEVFSLRTLLTNPRASLVLWSIAWTVIGGFCFYIWLWMIAGRETVSVQSDSLTIKLTLFGHVRGREYELRHVSNLRVDPEPRDSEGPRITAIYAFSTGPIAFEYGSKTVRFADGVSESEAHEIVNVLNRRLIGV